MSNFQPITILYAAALFLLGWLVFYLFIRLIFFAFATAFPLVKKINKTEEVISKTVNKFCSISTLVYFIIAALIVALTTWLCRKHIYLNISFYAGIILCFIMNIGKFSYKDKDMFDKFMMTYYSFILDDELRTHMYNKDLPKMRQRCRLMGVSHDWIPIGKNEK